MFLATDGGCITFKNISYKSFNTQINFLKKKKKKELG